MNSTYDNQLLRLVVSVGLFCLLSFKMLTGQPVTDTEGDVGVGTTTPAPSALVDMTSTSKGSLIPRMTTAERDAIVAPAEGLMIYNTDLGTLEFWSNASGSFRWDGVTTTGTNTGWLTDGNLGLTDGVNNILGTLDGTDLDVRTNNLTAMRISGVDQSVALTGNLAVDGNTQTSGNLDVEGVTTLDETEVDGTLTQSNGQVTLGGNVDATSGLDVTGADLTVATNASVTGNTQVGGDLNVDGRTTLDETEVDGALTQSGGQVTLGGNVDATSGLDVTGRLSLQGGISPLSANGSDGVSGDVLVSGGAGVTPSWASPTGLNLFWELDGNGGTTPGTNFIGTTDARALHLYVNSGSGANGLNSNGLILNINGSIQRHVGGGNVGGNPRGERAVDMQIKRSLASQVASEVASGLESVIGGGAGNTASNERATVAGGLKNTASGRRSTVGGGNSNIASGDWATVAGGADDIASGSYSAVGGGRSNRASEDYATVGGGTRNSASGYSSTIGGGVDNIASGSYSTVAGGSDNMTSVPYSTVGGGILNAVSGTYSAVPGGRGLILDTDADGSFGFLGGNFAGSGAGNHTMTINTPDIVLFGNTDLWLANNDNAASQLRLYEAYNTSGAFPNGTNYSSFEAGAQTVDINYILPATAPANAGEVLTAIGLSTTGSTTTVTLEWTESGVPVGTIVMWSGSVATIPTGWALCNGANGTPDLQGKFVLGAGTVAPGASGNGTTTNGTLTTSIDGAHTHEPGTGNLAAGGFALTGIIPTFPGFTVPGFTAFPGFSTPAVTLFGGLNLTIAGIGINIPALVVPGITIPSVTIPDVIIPAVNPNLPGPATTSSDGAHSHTTDVPYYALAYIMRTP